MAARAFIVLNVKGDMKKILLLIFTGFLLFSCAQDDLVTKPEPVIIDNDKLTAVDFVKGSEDVPLLENLELIEDSNNIDFDSVSGSVSTVDYKSQIDLEVVQNFYLETLPQMGWKMVATDPKVSRFMRDNDKVEIEFVEAEYDEDDDVVRFHLSSTPESENVLAKTKSETRFKVKSDNQAQEPSPSDNPEAQKTTKKPSKSKARYNLSH